jgi:endonuclease/exonuclease/phosphatase family metal-dependent hydrolase
MIRHFVALGVALALGTGAFAAHDNTIRVLTYNIHHAEGTDGKIDLDRITAIIRAEYPDVVCLQEVDRNMKRTNGLDMPSLLAAKLGMNVAFGPNLEIQGGYYGNATLTPHEILEQENLRLPSPENGETRGCLHTAIAIRGHTVQVYNTHLSTRKGERKAQASRIFELLADEAVVLAGDLNETHDAEGVQLLLKRLQDTADEMRGERKATIGDGDRARRIDYVLVSMDLRVVSAHVVDTAESRVASDHLPYLAEIDLGKLDPERFKQGYPPPDDRRPGEPLLP